MTARIGRLTTLHPVRVLLATLVVVGIAVVVGTPVTGLLNSDSDSFSDRDADSAAAVQRIEDATGVTSAPLVIALVNADDTTALREARDAMESVDGVAEVLGGPDAGPAFLSRDGDLTYLAATYDAQADADHVTEELTDTLMRVDGVTVGGAGPAFQSVNEQVEHDLVRAEAIAFPLLFLVSLWVFRSAVSALLPLLVGGTTIVLSLLVLRGVNAQLEISVFALNLITGLGLGLAIDYSLFMVSRFREETANGLGTLDAVRRTVATAGRTVAFSAATVAGAGLALLVFPLRFLYSMGVGVVIVALVAALVALLVLPALFSLLGHRVDALALKRWQGARDAESRAEHQGFWYRWSRLVMKAPALTALAGTALLLALGAPFLGIKFTGVDASVLPSDDPARVVDTTLRTQFEGADTSPILVTVDAPRGDADAVASYAQELGSLADATGTSEPAYLGDDTWRVDVLTDRTPLDGRTLDLVEAVRDVDAPGPALVGGQSADQVDQVAAIMAGIPWALLILAALTFVTLFLMTGSVVLPVKALLMNVLTISATFGILVLIFQDGRLEGLLDYTSQGALESSQPVFLFAVAFGLSTDYAVFLLTRIKEARDGGAGERESVMIGLQRTGRIVTAAALLFAIALGAFATSEIVFIKQLGVGTALAVLIDATLVRALLVPSLMALLGRANWWAPRPLRRLHDHIGVSEG